MEKLVIIKEKLTETTSIKESEPVPKVIHNIYIFYNEFQTYLDIMLFLSLLEKQSQKPTAVPL